MNWNELANRWTGRCPKCGERLNYQGTDGNGRCDNRWCSRNPNFTQPDPFEESPYVEAQVIGEVGDGRVATLADVINGENNAILCMDHHHFVRWATPQEALNCKRYRKPHHRIIRRPA